MSEKTLDYSGVVALAKKLLSRPARTFLAIAGAPGSGKSTIVERLKRDLEEDHPNQVEILPMDGFHFDDGLLHEMQRHPWKGAPDTFDVGGLSSTLKRLHDPNEGAVAVPVFDRALEISRGSARLIPQSAQLILVEGKYLLLDRPPWSRLAPHFDVTLMIDVPEHILRERLAERWENFGISPSDIARKVDENDIPNMRDVCSNSRAADFVLQQ